MKIDKKRLWDIINPDRIGDKLSKRIDLFIMILILLNTIAVIIGTINFIDKKYGTYLHYFEIFSITIFTIEYLSRIWLCTQSTKYEKPILGRLRFALSYYAIIDLAAILPFYLPFFTYDLRFIRMLRFLRIIRLLKIERYVSALGTIKKVFKRKKEELIITGTIFTIILTISSIIIFYAENAIQPHYFSDVLKTMWWSLNMLVRIETSPMRPITFLGKIFTSVIGVLGIGLIALPAGILSAGFLQIMVKKHKIKKCPHCGKDL